MQGVINPVVAGGLFATLQSAGAGGYGLLVVNTAVQGAALLIGGASWLASSKDKKEGEDKSMLMSTIRRMRVLVSRKNI